MTESLLTDLRYHVADGNTEAAVVTADELLDAFDDDRTEARRNDIVATHVRYDVDEGSDAAVAADEYLKAATERDQARIQLADAVVGFLYRGEDSEVLIDRIDETLAAYEAVRPKRDALLEHAEETSMGVVLHLDEVERTRVPVGSSVGATTTLENLGDQSERNIEFEASGEAPVSLTFSPPAFDDFAPGEREFVGLGLEGESTGQGRIRVAVEGEQTRESVQFSVEVLDRAGYLREVVDLTTMMLNDLEDATGEQGGGNGSNGLQNRLEGIRDRLENLLAQIQSSDGQPNVERRIGPVRNQYEAVVRTLENAPDHRYDPVNRVAYTQRAKEAVELLEASLEAVE